MSLLTVGKCNFRAAFPSLDGGGFLSKAVTVVN